MAQQPCFGGDPTRGREAMQAPILRYDTVAGDDDGNRVARQGAAHRPRAVWFSDARCHIAIGCHLPKRDAGCLLQHSALEIRQCVQTDGRIKAAAPARKIFRQFPLCPISDDFRLRAAAAGRDCARMRPRENLQSDDACWQATQQDRADRSLSEQALCFVLMGSGCWLLHGYRFHYPLLYRKSVPNRRVIVGFASSRKMALPLY